MPDWLVFSVVASLVLTVVANAVIRFIPGRAGPSAQGPIPRRAGPTRPEGDRRIQAYFPWKWMVGLSILGTIVLNLLR